MTHNDNAEAESAPETYYRERLELAMGLPFVDGSLAEVLNNGDEIFPAMLEAIEAAESTVDFATYVYWQGEIAVRFAEALASRAKAGVRVRIVLDSFGAKKVLNELLEMLEESGAEVRWFRPLANWRLWRTDKRTHRKLLICDDQIGFTGGVGIAKEWQGDARHPDEWRDIHLRFDGPAVGGLRAAFVENWNEAGSWDWDHMARAPEPRPGGVPVQIVRASAGVGWTDIATLLRSLVSLARREIRIATAYFVPDPKLLDLLEAASQRGVDVRILVPGEHSDSRLSRLAGVAGIEQLLARGIRVFRFDPTFLHTKCMTIDGQLSCIGSANMNHRSMGKDEECCAVVLCRQTAGELNQALARDRERSTELTLQLLRRRGLRTRIGEWFARRVVEEL